MRKLFFYGVVIILSGIFISVFFARALVRNPLVGSASLEYTLYEANINCSVASGTVAVVAGTQLDGLSLSSMTASVSSTGATGAIQLTPRKQRGATSTDMLSTPLFIDSSEYSSVTAATSSVINQSNATLAQGDIVYIDIRACHTTPSTGLFAPFEFQ